MDAFVCTGSCGMCGWGIDFSIDGFYRCVHGANELSREGCPVCCWLGGGGWCEIKEQQLRLRRGETEWRASDEGQR